MAAARSMSAAGLTRRRLTHDGTPPRDRAELMHAANPRQPTGGSPAAVRGSPARNREILQKHTRDTRNVTVLYASAPTRRRASALAAAASVGPSCRRPQTARPAAGSSSTRCQWPRAPLRRRGDVGDDRQLDGVVVLVADRVHAQRDRSWPRRPRAAAAAAASAAAAAAAAAAAVRRRLRWRRRRPPRADGYRRAAPRLPRPPWSVAPCRSWSCPHAWTSGARGDRLAERRRPPPPRVRRTSTSFGTYFITDCCIPSGVRNAVLDEREHRAPRRERRPPEVVAAQPHARVPR